MEGMLPGSHLICRACLKIVENKTQSFGFIEDSTGNIKDMIMCCVPEMDIYVSSNPIMCFPCIQLLVNVYNFKTRCINTETIIRSYIQRNNLTDYNHVNLTCVVQEVMKLNSYFRDAHNRQLEAEKQHAGEIPFRDNAEPYCAPLGPVVNNIGESQNNVNHPNLPRHYVIGRNENMIGGPNPGIEQGFLSTEQENGMLQSAEEFQNIVNKQIAEHQNIEGQNNVGGSRDPTCDITESHSNEANHASEENREKNKDLTTEKERTEETYKAVSFEESNNNGSMPKDGLQENCETDNRPRLIIKICKNKITLPPDKNEDSSEKENKEMDTVINKMEMPPPISTPFDAHQPQDTKEQQLYECSNCTFITTHFDYFEAHKAATCFGNGLGEIKCPHCPHVTNRQNALKKHINTMHTRSTWYSCDNCHYKSTDPSCLRRHKRNIHPDRLSMELTCHLCKYRCTTNYHLTKHMQKHDATLALHCQFCSYSTRDRSNFRKHVFIHNPKPQNCEFCNYKCVSPYQMKHHLKRMHHGVGMEDVDCRSELSISKVVQDISAAINEAKGTGDTSAE